MTSSGNVSISFNDKEKRSLPFDSPVFPFVGRNSIASHNPHIHPAFIDCQHSALPFPQMNDWKQQCSSKETVTKHELYPDTMVKEELNKTLEPVPKSVKCHQCSYCSYSTAYRGDLVKHTRAKHFQNYKPHVCSHCDFSSAYRESLAVHIKVQHSPHDVKFHKCLYCSYKTAYKSDLVKHTNAKHTKNKSKLHRCIECNFFSSYRESLLKHLKVKHSDNGAKCYPCTNCEYTTAYKSDLSKHVTAKHSSDCEEYKLPL